MPLVNAAFFINRQSLRPRLPGEARPTEDCLTHVNDVVIFSIRIANVVLFTIAISAAIPADRTSFVSRFFGG